MNLRSVVDLARLLRELLAEASGARTPLTRARQFATVIVGATTPFATTSYARARLIRQMHASGLLGDEDASRTQRLLELAAYDGGDAPR